MSVHQLGRLALAGGLIWGALAAAPAPAPVADRPADKILAEIRGVEMPQPAGIDRNDRQAVQQFILKRQAAMQRKADLIGELAQQHPNNPELLQLLPERWQVLASGPDTAEKAVEEINKVVATSKDPKLVAEAAAIKVVIAFRKATPDTNPDELLASVDEFAKRFPKDDRGAQMLEAVASIAKDPAKKAEVAKRIERDYPDSPVVANLAAARRQAEAIGKPFAIEFTDAIRGTKINSASLKGKVVVIDFWATWCGPCVAEMPKMKELYAKYRTQGVEFVGVSLDEPKEEGGLDKLKAFVAKNQIEWPQFYQGNGWQSEFSKGWGINAIPAVFLVGADGNLASVDARGKLEQLIPEQLAKAGHASTAKPAPATDAR